MKKLFKYMESFLHAILAILLISMTFFIATQVIARYVFQSPITWIEEMVRYMFIWSVMAGAVAAMAQNKHMNLDILSDKLSRKGRLVQDSAIRAIVCAYFVCLVVGGWMVLEQVSTQLSATLRISMAIPYSAICICAAIMAIQEIYFIVGNIKDLIRKEEIAT